MDTEKNIISRFSISLVFNVLRGILTLTTTIMLARFMGPEEYGRMAFLIASFIAVKSMLDMYSSHAFFTFLSQEKRSAAFVNAYWIWMGFQMFLSLLVVWILLPQQLFANIWFEENRGLVALALIATFMQHAVWQVASQMAEAQRQTVRVQKLGTLITAFFLLIILILEYLHFLTISSIFLLMIILWTAGSFGAYRLYKPTTEASDLGLKLLSKFWHYCKPLIPFLWIITVCEFAERWMLQSWGGSTEQSYYAVASNIMLVVSVAVISIIRIFWKEIAEAYNSQNLDFMKLLYERTSRLMFFFGATFFCALLPWYKSLVTIFLGADYTPAHLTFIILTLTSVYMGLGQINGAMLFATENSKLISIMGVFGAVLGIIISFFLLAPEKYFISGLEMGATGLALKMLITQIVIINISNYLISKKFNWEFKWGFQIYILLISLSFAFIIKMLTLSIFENLYAQIIVALCIYFACILIFAFYSSKSTLGLERSEIYQFTHQLRSKIKTK